jgi:Kef-type K+ transport system membrane component KefB
VSETSNLLLDLLIVFAAARLAGEVFERLHMPAVVGEILAGLLVGPSVLGVAHESSAIVTVATLGVVILQFAVGLETRPSDFVRAGWTAIAVAGMGVAFSVAGGYWFAQMAGYNSGTGLLVGTALASTSIGVTARVLKDRGLMGRRTSKLILASAVIDDITGPLLLSIVMGLSAGKVDSAHVLLIVGAIVAFLVFEMWLAPRLVNRHAHLVDKLHTPNAGFVLAVVIMLATAAAAEWIGLAAVVGAFLAGMMLAETEDRFSIARDSRPLYDWLVPYFFAVTGMRVDLSLFRDPKVLGLGLGLTAVAVAAKVIGCGIGALGGGWRRALAVGVAMVPRAEIGLIVASAGLTAGLVDKRLYAVIVFVVVATVLVVPPFVPPLMRLEKRAARSS